MAERPKSIKSILDSVRDRYYARITNATKPSTDSEKPKSPKDAVLPAKDSASSTLEARKEDTVEKSTSSVSAENLQKRSVKKEKKVLRKAGVPLVVLSREVATNEPTEMVDEVMADKGEEKIPTNLCPLDTFEETGILEQLFPQDEVTSQLSGKKTCSRSSSHFSGEVPPKKRKISADSLSVENVVIVENEETVVSIVALEDQNLIIQAEDTPQGSLIPSAIILDEDHVDKASERESTIPENDPIVDLTAVDFMEVNTNQEELPANNTDVSADPEEENLVKVEPSFQLVHDVQQADSITISDEEPVMNVSNATPNEEIQAVKAEMLRLKEELKMVKSELVNVKKELAEVKEKVPEASRSEHIINGAICLFQKLVRKGFISPEVAVDPSLWN